ncbi:2-acylglycerol O-acyltransferase 2-B isoform X2 [Hippocampus zosterae]|uniref:2-acylglycerol O-acyltransferase 2-B isoform X2 n=1 Tax=Hippocampus zosterae TaxID=109293 RepID=UPI00223CBE29|nr:2-acylglycerol O-acyltransferase 2-B isoform X2 [Hippocampus zosterae]
MQIRFAPLNVPLRRRLQTAAVLQWIFSFLGLAQCCLAAFILLSFSTWWMAALLYAGWLWLDWDTPNRGGRRCQWLRRWGVWEHFRDYFPIKLVKTVDLDPGKNYIFGFHPHGVLATGAFCNFCTESTGFTGLFPGLKSHLLMLPFWFRVPFFRDYIMCGGLVSSSKSSLSYLLSRPQGGNVAVIAVGAAPEALDARPGALTLQLRKRKGFIKLALRHGAQLVPVFSFGENELFDQIQNPTGSPLRTLQERLQSIMGIALPLVNGRGIFQYSFGLMPHRKAILTVGTIHPYMSTTTPGAPSLRLSLRTTQQCICLQWGSQSRSQPVRVQKARILTLFTKFT